MACGCDQSSHRNHLPSFLFVQVIFLLARRVPKEEGGARLGECQIKRRRAGHSLWVQRHGHSIVSWMQMRLLISLSHSFISSGCCFSTISSTSSTNKSNRYAYLTQMSMNQPTRVLGNCQLCHFSSIRTMSTGSADSTFWCHAEPTALIISCKSVLRLGIPQNCVWPVLWQLVIIWLLTGRMVVVFGDLTATGSLSLKQIKLKKFHLNFELNSTYTHLHKLWDFFCFSKKNVEIGEGGGIDSGRSLVWWKRFAFLSPSSPPIGIKRVYWSRRKRRHWFLLGCSLHLIRGTHRSSTKLKSRAKRRADTQTERCFSPGRNVSIRFHYSWIFHILFRLFAETNFFFWNNAAPFCWISLYSATLQFV